MNILGSVRNFLVKDYVKNGQHVESSNERSYAGGTVYGIPFDPSGKETLSFANELQISTLKACVKLLCDIAASIDIDFTKSTIENGEINKELFFPYFEPLINSQPNDFTNAFDLKHYWVFNSILDGEGYLYLDYNEKGRLENIYLLDRNTVRPYLSSDNKMFYHIGNQSQNSKLKFDQLVPDYLVLRLLGFSLDGKTAIPLKQHAQNTLRITFNTEQFALSYFTETKNHKGFIESPSTLKSADVETLKERLKTGGGENLGYGVLDKNMTYKQVANDGNDSQIVPPRKFQVEEVCRIMLTPPHKVGHLEKSSFNSFEQLNTEYYTNTVRPLFSKMELEIDNKLLYRRSQPSNVKIVSRFNTLELLRADTASRTAYYDTMNKIGVFSADDIRSKENEPTKGGQSAKKYNRLDTSSTDQQEIKTQTLEVELEIKKEELKQLQNEGKK